MSDEFAASGSKRALPTPRAETLVAQSASMEWEECGAPGFLIKPLHEDADAGRRTWLMKVEPGAYSPMHPHDEIEQFYVLEGSFSDQDRTYGPGDFAIRDAGFMHEAKSDDGAILLLFYHR